MNYENILFDLALINGGRFANIDDFCRTVVDELLLSTCENIEQVIQSVNTYIKTNTTRIPITEKNILQFLLSDDIKNFDFLSYPVSTEKEIHEMLLEHTNNVIRFFQSIGLHIDNNEIDLFFCDSFPKPFENVKASALAPDYYDYQKYGIKQGIYFLQKNISYYQSKLLIAHEVLHRVCSKKNPELLARGLEEGLCELLGSLLANSHFFDNTTVHNYIQYRRLKYCNQNQKFRLYTDYMRLAYLLYLHTGLDEIVNIINAGRARIKEVETLLLNGDFGEILGDNFVPVDNFSQSAQKLLLGTIENEVISPLAYYIICKYDNETTITDFVRKNDIALDDCEKAFVEIQDRVYGCIVNNDVIEFSDIIQLRKNLSVRYECK